MLACGHRLRRLSALTRAYHPAVVSTVSSTVSYGRNTANPVPIFFAPPNLRGFRPPLTDASDGGEGWSDSQIAAALETSVDTVARTRQRLVEEGLAAALTRKHSPNSARRRIFDGAAEARLIALACSTPPKGRARWTLQLLEEAVVELQIVERASDNTIGRTLKKTFSNRI